MSPVAPQPLEFLKTPSGSRLLVHKSFLYKQEKAVGDKVYWKCRQHSELGCRGRAITRGFRVTEMRDHCHPPEKEGLGKKRRQKEKLPSSGTKGQGDGVSLWLYPVEPEPTPQPSIEPPEEEQGYRSLALQSLPPKKRPTPGVGEYRSNPHRGRKEPLESSCPKKNVGFQMGSQKVLSQKYKHIHVTMGQTALCLGILGLSSFLL